MKCRDCVWIGPVNDRGLYMCMNKESQNFGAYTGLCCEDECEDGEEEGAE